MYIESVSVLANKRFSQCWLGKELSIIFGKEFNSLHPHQWQCVGAVERKSRLEIPGVQQRGRNVSLMTDMSTLLY